MVQCGGTILHVEKRSVQTDQGIFNVIYWQSMRILISVADIKLPLVPHARAMFFFKKELSLPQKLRYKAFLFDRT